MLTVDNDKLRTMLCLFELNDEILSVKELLRLDCDADKQDEDDNEIKLFYKVSFHSGSPVVVKLRGGCTQRNMPKVIEKQSEFASILRDKGIPTPKYHKANGAYIVKQEIDGYRITVTIEDFVDKEISGVNEDIAYKTGAVLAAAHNISEKFDCHVPNLVIFDPFARNDLFDYKEFRKTEPELPEESLDLFRIICDRYDKKMKLLEPLKSRTRYAVQGDISDCNTYFCNDGSVGVFDYNCCGDNILFCDAVMQGWFEAHLMEYCDPITEELSEKIFKNFLSGYNSVRRFTDEEKSFIPILYSVIGAFDRRLIIFNDNSLMKSINIGDFVTVQKHMQAIKKKIESEIDIGFLD